MTTSVTLAAAVHYNNSILTKECLFTKITDLNIHPCPIPQYFLHLLLKIKQTPIMEQKIHQGRNVKRFREMLGIKQDALAFDLGEDWNQKKISVLEQKEVVEYALLQKISEVMKIPVEAFQNFDEEAAINIISNTFNDQSNGYNYYPTITINPVEKWLETLEEIKKLNEEKAALYERMLKEKNEMIEKLEKIISNK